MNWNLFYDKINELRQSITENQSNILGNKTILTDLMHKVKNINNHIDNLQFQINMIHIILGVLIIVIIGLIISNIILHRRINKRMK